MGDRIKGKIERHQKGYGFLLPEREDMEDIFIPPGQLNGSMSGDRVEIKIQPSSRGKNDVGKVLRILQRGVRNIVGRVKLLKDKTVVIPQGIELPSSIRVPDQTNSSRVEGGELVEVEIESYEPLRGIIIDVLGEPGDPKVEEKVILKKYELNQSFPPEVERAAENLPDTVPEDMKSDRRDLTDLTVITIDPYDAKDLDDAVSVTVTDSGNIRVGVHITDVSHYVSEGSVLDTEARKRATSTYLAEDVIPMFPKPFSNGIGSLNDGEKRLAITVFLTVDPSGKVTESEFCESIINVDRRFSYREIDEYLESGAESVDFDDYLSIIDTIIDISQKMRARRMDRGSLDFDLPEVSLRLSEGEVEEIIQVEHTLSHQAIEEFMIAANEAVAEFLSERQVPMLYRIHEPPDEREIEEFANFIEGLGLQISIENFRKNSHPDAFQRVLASTEDKPQERVVAWHLLRAMKRARYSPQNLKHFGLASSCYCHFTSPIRRYPDLVNHRIIKKVLRNGSISRKQKGELREALPELAKHTSEREQMATDAERESINVKLLIHMRDKVGEEFEGYISSVLEFGCFVQLENTLEGLVHVSQLDDYFVFNESDYTLRGESSGRVLHIGDRVKVKVAKVDVSNRELDFELLDVLETHI